MDENQTPQAENDTPAPKDQSTVNVVLELESMIKSHLTQIDSLESDYSKHKDMLEDIFNNDATYKEHAEKAKEANRIKSNTKQQIMKQPQVADLANKVKSIKQEIKELQDALTDYLREFQRISGLNEIEGDDGEIREIVYIPRLVRKTYQKE